MKHVTNSLCILLSALESCVYDLSWLNCLSTRYGMRLLIERGHQNTPLVIRNKEFNVCIEGFALTVTLYSFTSVT